YLITGIGNNAQIGKKVFDLLSVEEALTPHQAIGDPRSAHFLLEHPWLLVGAKEDGDVAGYDTLRVFPIDLLKNLSDHGLSFVILVLVGDESWAFPTRACGLEHLFMAH